MSQLSPNLMGDEPKNESLKVDSPNLLKKPPYVKYGLTFLVLIVIIVGGFFVYKNIGSKPNKPTNTSKPELILEKEYGEDNFGLKPAKVDGLGVAPDTEFILTSKKPIKAQLVSTYFQVEPKIEYDIKELASSENNLTQFSIKPKINLAENVIYKMAIDTAYNDDNGVKKERDYKWAYQTKNVFKVIVSLPRDKANYVPVNTGIEFMFSYDNLNADIFAKSFSINPSVTGKFKVNKQNIAFIPDKDLARNSIYTITIKKDFHPADSDKTLDQDYVVSFQTEAEQMFSAKNDPDYFFVNANQEYKKGEDIILPIYQNNLKEKTNVNVDIYRFANIDEYLKTYDKYLKTPYWAITDDSKRALDVSKLTKFISQPASVELSGNGYSYFLRVSPKLDNGFYIVQGEINKHKTQTLLQITPLTSYVVTSKNKSLVWINNLESKRGVNKAQINLVGTDLIFSTDENGLAEFNLPEVLRNASEAKNYLYKITDGSNGLVTLQEPVGYKISDPGNLDESNYVGSAQYWRYIYSDRSVYLPKDKIKIWGMVKARYNQSLQPKKVHLALVKDKSWYFDQTKRIAIEEKDVDLSDFNTYVSEFNLNNLEVGAYKIVVSANNSVIIEKNIEISSYVKPAYQVEISASKQAGYVGSDIQFDIKTSFFEGTPVPNMEFKYSGTWGEGKFKTDQSGRAKLNFKLQDQYKSGDYYPKTNSISINPVQTEAGEITGYAEVGVFYSQINKEITTSYSTKENKVKVKTKLNYFDVDKLNNENINYNFASSYLGAPAANKEVRGKLFEITYRQVVDREEYDPIAKKKYKIYRYESEEKVLQEFSGMTDNNGEYIFEKAAIAPDLNRDYKVEISTKDDTGKETIDQRWIYLCGCYNSSPSDNEVSLTLEKSDFESTKNYETYDYKINDNVSLVLKNNYKDIKSDISKDSFVYYLAQNGIYKYYLSKDPSIQFAFDNNTAPSTNVFAVWFDGKDFNYTSQTIYLDQKQKTLKVDLVTDKESYQPGSQAKISVQVKDKDNKPVQAEVNLNLVDEAFYKLYNDQADPVRDINESLEDGIYSTSYTHHEKFMSGMGAEFGGCFLEGTQILMADRKEKTIENIKVGDYIITKESPDSDKLVTDKVVKVFRHIVKEYLVINGTLNVTAIHNIYLNGVWQPIGNAKQGDWLVNEKGEKVYINSIEKINKVVKVYNFETEKYHTYFANGIYVHNSKGGSVRSEFPDLAYFGSVKTDNNGKAEVNFKLPDNVTSFRITAQAIDKDLQSGVNQSNDLKVSLPFFVDTVAANSYLMGDEPIIKIRGFGSGINYTKDNNYKISIPSLDGGNSYQTIAKADAAVEYKLPSLKLGQHDVTVAGKNGENEDAIKKSFLVKEATIYTKALANYRLTNDLKIDLAQDNGNIEMLFTDNGRGRYNGELQNLYWSYYDDRLDTIVSQKLAADLANKYFNAQLNYSDKQMSNYQVYDGGLSLFPYSSSDLELSALVAYAGIDNIDKENLKAYFYSELYSDKANASQVAQSLFGLASLGEPVLQQQVQMLNNKDLNQIDRIYLGFGLDRLGATEYSRIIFHDIAKNYAENNDDMTVIKIGKDKDDYLKTTILMGILGNICKIDSTKLFNYLKANATTNEWLNLQRSLYIAKDIENLNAQTVKFSYKINDKEQTIDLKDGNVFKMELTSQQAKEIRFSTITGKANLSVLYKKPLDQASTKDQNISLSKVFKVNNQPKNQFNESDLIKIEIVSEFKPSAQDGIYEITDTLPSGLAPYTGTVYADFDISGFCTTKCDENPTLYQPYEINGQVLKFVVTKNYPKKFYYFARAVNKGKYNVLPAISQSLSSPALYNTSASNQTIEVK